MKPRYKANTREVEITKEAGELMQAVRRAYESVQPLMDQAIEQNAREILKQLPIVHEYVQAMGSWTFTVVLTAADGKPHYKGRMLWGLGDEIEIDTILEDHDAFKDDEAEKGGVVCVEHYGMLVKLRGLLAGHGEMLGELDEMFGCGRSPMRFTADGPKVTDW